MSESANEATPPAAAEPVVIERSRGGVGTLTLNRPRAINALDIDTIRALTAAFERFASDTDVDRIALRGAGERGFCAGGDVRALRGAIEAGRPQDAELFLREEYHLNALIASFPKPVIAFADGVTMGGGIGLAGHASVRIVTERSLLAMPETRIGFVPDVGGTYLLSRAPGRIGEYLALTGAAIGAADAIYAGLADHLIPSRHLESFHDALETRADPAGANELALIFDETPEPAPLASARAWIDDAFSAGTVAGIARRLAERDETDAARALETMSEVSPVSLTAALAAVRRSRQLTSLRDALALEYGIACWIIRTQPDLPEGVRAQLVDKDRDPRWTFPSLFDVHDRLEGEALGWVPETPLWP